MAFLKNFQSLKLALDSAIKNNVNLANKIDTSKALLDFKAKQKQYYQERLENSIKNLADSALELHSFKQDNELGQEKIRQIIELSSELTNKKDLEDIAKSLKKIDVLISQVRFPSEKDKFVKIPRNIPSDIKTDMVLDLDELDKCYENACYRSCVILCGRLLETALHRKYYEATGNDVLEKNPGIGLGNLISKLHDKGVMVDPALTNQIHLINQVRVFSVHKKKEPFNPSHQQTQAMILYTLDVLEKIFNS